MIYSRNGGPLRGHDLEPIGGGPSGSRPSVTDKAGVIAPPPLIFGLALVGGFCVDQMLRLPRPSAGLGLRLVLAGLLASLAAFLGVSAIRAFRRLNTSVLPERPSTAIAETGVYRYTRNPMYLGLACAYAAAAVALDRPGILVGLPAALIVVHFGVVKREERYLAAKFGTVYRQYCARVPRWI